MKPSPKYLALFIIFFALFKSPGLSASINTNNPCCDPISATLADEVVEESIENATTPPKQIQILFNHSQSQIAAKERRILIPLFATGLLTLLAFIRV